jgi:hypothetical protein
VSDGKASATREHKGKTCEEEQVTKRRGAATVRQETEMMNDECGMMKNNRVAR